MLSTLICPFDPPSHSLIPRGAADTSCKPSKIEANTALTVFVQVSHLLRETVLCPDETLCLLLPSSDFVRLRLGLDVKPEKHEIDELIIRLKHQGNRLAVLARVRFHASEVAVSGIVPGASCVSACDRPREMTGRRMGSGSLLR